MKDCNGNPIIKLIFISLVVMMTLLPWGPLWGGNSVYNILCTIMN